MDRANLLTQARSGKIKKIFPKHFREIMPDLKRMGLYAYMIEASEQRGEWEVPKTYLSLLGLHYDDFDNKSDHDLHEQLIFRLIDEAIATGLPIFYEVWIGQRNWKDNRD